MDALMSDGLFDSVVSFAMFYYVLIHCILESEWKAVSRCRRVWAAMALSAVLTGHSSLTDIGLSFDCSAGDLEDLRRNAKVRKGGGKEGKREEGGVNAGE